MLLAVSQGHPFTLAAQHVGRTSGNAVARLIRRFNLEGLEALTPRHGGGHVVEYTPEVRSTIIAEALRTPDPELDGTATWSLTTLQRSLRNKGLPLISTYTVWTVLHEAGLSWRGQARKASRPVSAVLLKTCRFVQDSAREPGVKPVWLTDNVKPESSRSPTRMRKQKKDNRAGVSRGGTLGTLGVGPG